VWIEPATALKVAEVATGKKPADWAVWFRDIIRVAVKGRLNIFVVGGAGTGKSSLKQFLISGDTSAIPTEHVSTSTREREHAAKIESLSRLYDYPGQTRRFLDEFHRDAATFQGGARNIVLMCCAYGYHSDWGQAAGMGSKPEILAPTSTTMEAALADCRKSELEFLDRFFERYASGVTGRLELMTVVLKHDLWFDEHHQVGQFYTGPYMEIIRNKYEHSLGTHRFRHDIFACCLTRETFVSKIGEVHESKESRIGSYSPALERGFRTRFLQTLESWVKRTRD
jgi:hypothetical protein